MAGTTCSVTINGTTLEVPEGLNLVSAAELADQEIPHYCYHPSLRAPANCRMFPGSTPPVRSSVTVQRCW